MIGLEVSVLDGCMEYTNVIVDDNQIGAMNAGEVELTCQRPEWVVVPRRFEQPRPEPRRRYRKHQRRRDSLP